MLKLKKITKNYLTGDMTVRALKGVSLDFRRSEFVSILGPSGCGKTTMLNIIGGLDRYTDGDLIIDGKSTKDFKDRDWDSYRNHCVGYVFQSYNLIPHLTVLSNVELALTISGESRAERRKKAADVLEKVGLGDQLNKKPNQMSGGQMQRVAIARALVNDPQIIMADEPTGALDTKTSGQIINLLKEISRERLVIMVTHNTELAEKYSTRIIRLLDGEITDDTNPVTEEELTATARNEKNKAVSLWQTADKERLEQKQKAKQQKQDAKQETQTGQGGQAEKVKVRRTSMSFFTALNLSFKNLWTKKGRTFMVSFAGSIGIIGIALVLAISNGFKQYINKIETETLSNFPISISRTAIDLAALSSGAAMGNSERVEKYPSGGTSVDFYESQNSMAAIMKTNVITKEYVEYVEKIKTMTATSGTYKGQSIALDVQKSYSVNLPMVTTYDRTGKSMYISNYTNSSNNLLSMFGGSSSRFTEMLDNPDFVAEQYDLLYGEYPSAYNEIALIVDESNRISKNMAKSLGFNEALEKMDFDAILEKTYKIVTHDAFYLTNTENNTVRTINTGDEEVLNNIFNREDGDGVIELKVKGIMRINKNAVMEIYSPGMVYMPSLTNIYLNTCRDADVAEMQTEALSGNIQDYQVYKSLFRESELNNDFLDAIDFYESMKTSISEIPGGDLFFLMPKESQISFLGQMLKMNEDYSDLDESTIIEFATMFICMESAIEQLNNKNSNTFGFAAYYFKELLSSGFAPISSTKETIMQRLGIGGLPSTIYIYPRNFETKAQILAYLEDWNTNHPDNKITPTDPAEMLSSTMGQMIDMISYVLIAFAAVSLIVSSIMIGIITYVSVIERTKEIGVLRSIGARKRDVGNVFNAETVLIGLVAGVLGIIVSYLLCIPINIIIKSLAGSAVVGNLAILNPLHALVMIGISVVLTLISGLIPSTIASNRDPVVALRSE